jgi:hypothetical protein
MALAVFSGSISSGGAGWLAVLTAQKRHPSAGLALFTHVYFAVKTRFN